MAEDEYLLATITITKTMTNDDVILQVKATDPTGDDIALVDALGMIELGKDTLIRQKMGEIPDDEEG